MRVLVTGAGGFVGPYVVSALRAHGHEVHALVRGPAGEALAAAAVHRADLCDAGALGGVIRSVAPEGVIHLAGHSFAPTAEADPPAAYRANLDGTLGLLAALRAHAPRARLVHVSTGDVYGAVTPADLPIAETTELRPVGIYGASKAAGEIAAAQWGRAYGLDVVRVRPFNHTGPGQSPSFVCPALARQVALVEAGGQPPRFRVGNVDPVRDFSDVRDIAAGHVAALERGSAGAVYNLCRGEGVSIAEVVAILRTIARVPIALRIDPALRRPVDVPRIVGSAARAGAALGWRAGIPLETTLATLVEHWRAEVRAGRA